MSTWPRHRGGESYQHADEGQDSLLAPVLGIQVAHVGGATKPLSEVKRDRGLRAACGHAAQRARTAADAQRRDAEDGAGVRRQVGHAVQAVEVRREHVQRHRKVVQDVREQSVGFGFGEERRAEGVGSEDGCDVLVKVAGGLRRGDVLVTRLHTSCRTLTRMAFVAEADASPTPNPDEVVFVSRSRNAKEMTHLLARLLRLAVQPESCRTPAERYRFGIWTAPQPAFCSGPRC
jgi:hypothetical protein